MFIYELHTGGSKSGLDQEPSGGPVDSPQPLSTRFVQDDNERSLGGMSTARYIEEDQVPGPGGRWIAAPPLPPQEIGNPPTAAAAAAAVTTTTAANPTPLLLFRAYRRSFPGQQHRQHDSYVWIEVDSSSLVVLEPLRKTFPTLGTLYDPKPAVRLSLSSPVVFTREKGAKREADMTRLLDVFTFPTIPPHRSISAPFTPTPTSFSRMQLS